MAGLGLGGGLRKEKRPPSISDGQESRFSFYRANERPIDIVTMMQKTILVLNALLFGITALISGEERGTALPDLVVTGEGYAEVFSDQLRWNLEVRTVDLDLEAVATRHQDQVREVLEFVGGLQVTPDSLETTPVQSGENWIYRAGERQRGGYFGSAVVSFAMDDFDDYLPMWRALEDWNGVSVREILWSYSGAPDLWEGLRQQAMARARERAEVLAGTLGVALGDPLVIEEMESGAPEIPMRRNQMRRAMDEGSEEGLVPIPLAFRVFVRVIFEVE